MLLKTWVAGECIVILPPKKPSRTGKAKYMYVCIRVSQRYTYTCWAALMWKYEVQNAPKSDIFSNIGMTESTSENSLLDFIIFVGELLLQIYLQVKHVQPKLRPETPCAGMEGHDERWGALFTLWCPLGPCGSVYLIHFCTLSCSPGIQ